jgi:hypothetical protein
VKTKIRGTSTDGWTEMERHQRVTVQDGRVFPLKLMQRIYEPNSLRLSMLGRGRANDVKFKAQEIVFVVGSGSDAATEYWREEIPIGRGSIASCAPV